MHAPSGERGLDRAAAQLDRRPAVAPRWPHPRRLPLAPRQPQSGGARAGGTARRTDGHPHGHRHPAATPVDQLVSLGLPTTPTCRCTSLSLSAAGDSALQPGQAERPRRRADDPLSRGSTTTRRPGKAIAAESWRRCARHGRPWRAVRTCCRPWQCFRRYGQLCATDVPASLLGTVTMHNRGEASADVVAQASAEASPPAVQNHDERPGEDNKLGRSTTNHGILTGRRSPPGLELTGGPESARFETYYQELVEWNARFQPHGIVEYAEVQRRHFLDSLTVLLAEETGRDCPARPSNRRRQRRRFSGSPASRSCAPTCAWCCSKRRQEDDLPTPPGRAARAGRRSRSHGRSEDVPTSGAAATYDLALARAVASLRP